ncbi:MAG: hypothetical protein IKE37_06235, partial [Firmicutes bacterium]|nr:hypothetical protein [Bacillota bacterium]
RDEAGEPGARLFLLIAFRLPEDHKKPRDQKPKPEKPGYQTNEKSHDAHLPCSICDKDIEERLNAVCGFS